MLILSFPVHVAKVLLLQFSYVKTIGNTAVFFFPVALKYCFLPSEGDVQKKRVTITKPHRVTHHLLQQRGALHIKTATRKIYRK